MAMLVEVIELQILTESTNNFANVYRLTCYPFYLQKDRMCMNGWLNIFGTKIWNNVMLSKYGKSVYAIQSILALFSNLVQTNVTYLGNINSMADDGLFTIVN